MNIWQYIEIAGVAIGLLYLYFEYQASVWLWLTGIIMPALYIFVYYESGFYADMGINIYYLFAGFYGWAAWLGQSRKKKGAVPAGAGAAYEADTPTAPEIAPVSATGIGSDFAQASDAAHALGTDFGADTMPYVNTASAIALSPEIAEFTTLGISSGISAPEAATEIAAEAAMPITRTPTRFWLPLALIAIAFFAAISYILINFTDSTVPLGDSFTTALSIVGLWMLARKYVEQWLVWIVVDVICSGLYLYKGLYLTGALFGLYSIIAVFGYFKWLRLMREGK